MKLSSKTIPPFHTGVELDLLVNGEAFYPRLWEDLQAAQSDVLIETFIVFDDEVGAQLADVLCATAERGVNVHLTIDGWGCAWLPTAYAERLQKSGVHLHVVDPVSSVTRKLGLRPNMFRRMHRKLVAIDRKIAYVGV